MALMHSEGPEMTFDWFLSPMYLLPLLEELTATRGKETRILMLGCGNSGLSEIVSFTKYPQRIRPSGKPWFLRSFLHCRPGKQLIDQMYDAGWHNIVNVDVSLSTISPCRAYL